jgi:hypothetical protein
MSAKDVFDFNDEDFSLANKSINSFFSSLSSPFIDRFISNKTINQCVALSQLKKFQFLLSVFHVSPQVNPPVPPSPFTSYRFPASDQIPLTPFVVEMMKAYTIMVKESELKEYCVKQEEMERRLIGEVEEDVREDEGEDKKEGKEGSEKEDEEEEEEEDEEEEEEEEDEDDVENKRYNVIKQMWEIRDRMEKREMDVRDRAGMQVGFGRGTCTAVAEEKAFVAAQTEDGRRLWELAEAEKVLTEEERRKRLEKA